jgi:hypothetical protein
VWAVLAVGHNLADHVSGQSDHQAVNEEAPSAATVADGVSPRRGWGACLAHAAQYHVVMAAMVATVLLVLPLSLSRNSWARSPSAPRLSGSAGSPVVVIQQSGQQLGQPLPLLG